MMRSEELQTLCTHVLGTVLCRDIQHTRYNDYSILKMKLCQTLPRDWRQLTSLVKIELFNLNY